jgi:hypothetical protein
MTMMMTMAMAATSIVVVSGRDGKRSKCCLDVLARGATRQAVRHRTSRKHDGSNTAVCEAVGEITAENLCVGKVGE